MSKESDGTLIALGALVAAGAGLWAYHLVKKDEEKIDTSSEKLGYEPATSESKKATERFIEKVSYFPPLTAEEEAMLKELSPKAKVLQRLESINTRAEDLYDRWMAWATWKWGPQGFAANVAPAKLSEFQSDKHDFYEFFYDWFEKDWVPGQFRYAAAPPWKKRYAKYKAPGVEQYIPGYWNEALREMFEDARQMNYAEAMFKKKLKETPSYVDPVIIAKK